MESKQTKNLKEKEALKKSLNRCIKAMVRMSEIVNNEAQGPKTRKAALNAMKRRKEELNHLWVLYYRLIG